MEKIKKQREERIRKENKKASERVDLVDAVNLMGGQCKSISEIDNLIKNEKKSIQKPRLQKQIKYFQNVLGLKAPNFKWFQFSDKRTGSYSVEKLKSNLGNLIQNLNQNMSTANNVNENNGPGVVNVIKNPEERNQLCSNEKQQGRTPYIKTPFVSHIYII